MITFQIKASVEDSAFLQERTVEYVCKSVIIHPNFQKIVTWKGALEKEYFSILFSNGTLIVCVAECEYLLGNNPVSYAESDSFVKLQSDMSNETTDEGKDKINMEYVMKTMKLESDTITFDDVMAVLNWKYAEFAKVDEDVLSDL